MFPWEAHFNGKRPIDGIISNEIEDFLDSKETTGRRRNNLRSEIITLFRYAQIRLRALHRDRKTEAELVLRDQTKRKQVETFSPEEFDAFLGTVRLEWLPWLALGGLAGIRTDGEIFRIRWECFKWDRRIIDLDPAITKINERRHVPLCDRLVDLLVTVRRDSGPVINLKKPEDETERLAQMTGIPWRRNALRRLIQSSLLQNHLIESLETGICFTNDDNAGVRNYLAVMPIIDSHIGTRGTNKPLCLLYNCLTKSQARACLWRMSTKLRRRLFQMF